MSDQDFILEDEKDKEINMKTSMGGQDDQPEKGVDSGNDSAAGTVKDEIAATEKNDGDSDDAIVRRA